MLFKKVFFWGPFNLAHPVFFLKLHCRLWVTLCVDNVLNKNILVHTRIGVARIYNWCFWFLHALPMLIDCLLVLQLKLVDSTICVLYSHCPISCVLKTFRFLDLGPRIPSGYALHTQKRTLLFV